VVPRRFDFMPQRYAESILGMVRRDRNHPSVTMWGLLNEDARGLRLPAGRRDPPEVAGARRLPSGDAKQRPVGRQGGVAGIQVWRNDDRTDPCVTRNGTDHVIQALGITWAPGMLAFHPGLYGEYAVVCWTAPDKGQVGVEAVFRSIAERATTDVHVFHNGKALFDDVLT